MQVAWKKHCSVCNMFSWEFRMLWTLWEKGTHPSLFFQRRLQGCKRCYHLLINLQIKFRLVKWQDYIFFCKIWCLKRGSQCYWTRTRMESSRNRDPILCIKPERIWRVTLEWVREKKANVGGVRCRKKLAGSRFKKSVHVSDFSAWDQTHPSNPSAKIWNFIWNEKHIQVQLLCLLRWWREQDLAGLFRAQTTEAQRCPPSSFLGWHLRAFPPL